MRIADPQKAEKEFLKMTNEIEPRERSYGFADAAFKQGDQARKKSAEHPEQERFRYNNDGWGRYTPTIQERHGAR